MGQAHDIPQLSYVDAGMIAAHEMMVRAGLPKAIEVFQCMAPQDMEAVADSGKPPEFWAAMYAELASVMGTA